MKVDREIVIVEARKEASKYHDVIGQNIAYKSFLSGVKYNRQKLYTEQDMIDFAWYLKNNLGKYSDDEMANKNGEYLKEWKSNIIKS